MTVKLVSALRFLNTVLRLAGNVSILGIERRACRLVANRWLAIRRRAGISVPFAIGRLLLGVATLSISGLVVVHLVGVVVLVATGGTPSWSAAEPAGPLHGTHAAPTIPSSDAQATGQDNQCHNDGDAGEHPSAPEEPATLALAAISIGEEPESTTVVSSEDVHYRSHDWKMGGGMPLSQIRVDENERMRG